MKYFLTPGLMLISIVAMADAPKGWQELSGNWITSSGVVTGQADGAQAAIQTEAFYNDFVLELEFLTNAESSGSVQIRSHWLPKETDSNTNILYGYRYGIYTGAKDATAQIWDVGGRGHLVKTSPEAQEAVKAGDWNRMRIEARGSTMSAWINDVKANHLFDEKFLGGRIALTVETDQIQFRNIKFTDLGRLGKWRSLFNGKSTKGWKVYGSERFDVEDGAIIGRSGPKKSEGYLLTDETWTDFRVRGSFIMLGAGNFGLFYRSKIKLREKDGYPLISGVQGEVDPAYPGPSGWHYESYRRGWIHEPPQKDPLRAYAATPDVWGEIEIRAIGNRTYSWINGIRIVDFYDDNPQVFEGGFALQLHAGGVEGIMWKDLFVKE